MNVAEDIQIGADTSQAVANIGAIGKAFEQAARAAGVANKDMNAALRQQERATGTLVAGIARANASRTQERRTIQELIGAERQLAAAKRASQKSGVTREFGGPARDVNTGQFVSKERSQEYQRQYELATRLYEREQDIARQRERAATQARLNQTFSTPGRSAGSAEVAAYERSASAAQRLADRQADINRMRERSARQLQLETAFASKFYGVADQGAGRLRRVANVLAQIPPATWGQKIGDAGRRISDMSNSTRYALYDVSNSFGVAGAAMVAFGAAGIGAAVAHERAFANVRRTTQTTAEGYEYLRRQLEQMAMTLPVTYEEITNIASAAGQLGISASGVASFTQTVAKLSATTNLTSEAAGTALSRFKAFFAETGGDGLAVTEQTFSNLASSILKVGVNSIATETGIVNVATQIASMGQYSGMTANQVIGLAGALSSIGVAPELARGTITRTFSLIGQAVSEGGDKLEKFASLAGMTSEDFKASWGTEKFAGTFQAMMQGLYGVTQSSKDANLMLMELGFNSVRDRPLLLRLAGAADEAGRAGGLLAQTMADAYDGWVQNSELALQYSKISETTAARLQVLGQAFEQLFATMGAQSGSALGELASGLTDFVRGLESLAASDGGQILGSIAVQAALAGGGLFLLISVGARAVASIQGIGQAYGAMKVAGVGAATAIGQAFRIANLALGLVGLAGAVVGLVVGFGSMIDASQKAKRGLQDVDGLVGAMATDAKNGAAGIKFYADASKGAGAESAATSRQAEAMADALSGVGKDANSGADGVKRMADESERAAYVFGSAAKSFYKSQLLQSEQFQTFFDPSKQWGTTELNNFFGQGFTLKQLGVTPDMLDWDKLIEDSMKGGASSGSIYKDLLEKTGIKEFTSDGELTAKAANLKAVAGELGKAFGDVSNEVQGAVNGAAALQTTTTDAFKGLMDGALDAASAVEQMDEAAQKAIDSMAQGYAKFADASSLIKLTQQQGAMSADEFEKAWSDAYGGASFKLSDYLANFQRAAKEQEGFVNNLQSLSVRGLSQGVIAELSAMGPEANRLVQALVKGTDEQLAEFEALWGQTGYDAMVLFAAQTYMAEQLVQDTLQKHGQAGLKKFTDALASGKGVNEALAAVQGKLDANPLDPKAKTPRIPDLTGAQKAQWAARNRMETTGYINVYTRMRGGGVSGMVDSNGRPIDPRQSFASGGWTGPGSKYTPAGEVHADEFVFTKKATNALGVGNLYRLMAQAERGKPAPRGRGKGYANGGHVGGVPGMGGGVQLVALSPEDRALLRSIQPLVRIGNRDIAQAQAEANFTNKRQGVG